MVQKIYSFEKRQDYIIEITFFNGDIKQFDISLLFETLPQFSRFVDNQEEIGKGVISKAKDKLIWENGLEVAAEQLWYDGVLVGYYNIEDPAVKLACMLMEARYNASISQRELEARTGVKQAEISKIERAEGNPSIATVGKLFSGMGRVIGFDNTRSTGSTKTDIAVPESCRPYLNANRLQGQFTTRDIAMLPEGIRVELFDGILYDMAVPTYVHELIVAELILDFGTYIRENKGKCRVSGSSTGVWFDPDDRNFVVPDMIVVCDKSKMDKKGIVGGPDFVLEVVSESSRVRDFKMKKTLYEEKGVREYWIIDPRRKCLVIYDFENPNETFSAEIHGLNEIIGVGIYDGNLKIDLRGIARIIDENNIEE